MGGVRGEWWKEEERISQRTCMSDPWTWTTVWGLTVGAGDGLDGGGQRGKDWDWDNYKRINENKKKTDGQQHHVKKVGINSQATLDKTSLPYQCIRL